MSLHHRFSMQRMSAITLRQFYLYRGSPTRVLSIFLWVAIDIVLWGYITRYLDAISTQAHAFVPKLLGAVLLWDFLTRVMFGITTAFFEDVWSRNFLNLFASPLRLPEYIGGLVLAGLATSLIGLVVMLGIVQWVFGFSLAYYGGAALVFLVLLLLFGLTLGVLGSAIVLRFGPSAEWLIWPIPACIAPFVGVFYPLNTLPAWMQTVGAALPPSYVFEGLRSLAAGGVMDWQSLAIAAGITILDFALACWLFGWVFSYAKRTGLIARYSAENAS